MLASLSSMQLIGTLVALVAASVAVWLWRRSSGGPLRITRLFIYPVKSCGGIELTSSDFNRLGFRYDREWMILSLDDAGSGRFLTAREAPQLVQIQPSIDEAKGTMTLTFKLDPSLGSITVPLQRPAPADVKADQRIKALLWDGPLLDTLRVSDEASAWVTRVAQWQKPGAAALSEVAAARRYELVSVCGVQEHERPLPPDFDYSSADAPVAAGGFSDAFPFLVTTEASLRALNRWTVPNGRRVEMEAFRPNIVLAGGGIQPFEEDYWRHVSMGGGTAAGSSDVCSFVVAKPCTRCVLTTVVPGTGERHPSGEPLISMRAHRKILGGVDGMEEEVVFGQNLVQLRSANGRLRVGDPVFVTQRKPTPFERAPSANKRK